MHHRSLYPEKCCLVLREEESMEPLTWEIPVKFVNWSTWILCCYSIAEKCKLFHWQKKSQLTFWPSPCGNAGYAFPVQHLRYCGVRGDLLLKPIERMAVLLKLWCQGVWIPKHVGGKVAAKRKLKKIMCFNHLISEDVCKFSCAPWTKVVSHTPLSLNVEESLVWQRQLEAIAIFVFHLRCTTVSHCVSLTEV